MAYVLAPVLYSYERRGAVVIEPGHDRISLRREASGWKVIGWGWAGFKCTGFGAGQHRQPLFAFRVTRRAAGVLSLSSSKL